MFASIAPHGKTVCLHLHRGQDGTAFLTYHRSNLTNLQEELQSVVDVYAPGAEGRQIHEGQEVDGLLIRRGDHDCLTVQTAYPMSGSSDRCSVFISFETASGLASYIKREADGLPHPRKRTRR